MFARKPPKDSDDKEKKKEVTIDESNDGKKDKKHDKKEDKKNDKRNGKGSHAGDGTVVVSKEAVKALAGGLPDAIVDIRVTANEKQVAEVARQEYVQLFQDEGNTRIVEQGSTFGNKSSLWLWKRSKGTCSGRLKPIVDIQLHNKAVDSAFVLAGYTCDGVGISGQYLWIRRAISEDEEKDAIVDLYITTGKMKDASDPIWTSPGVGWVHVDGNFTKSTMGRGLDTLVWMRPARSRSSEAQYVSPLRAAVAMTDEVKYAKLLSVARLGLRHYVHLDDMKRLATLLMETGNIGAANSMTRSERLKDFTALFHKVGAKGALNSSKFSNMIYEVGLRLAKPDVNILFNLFDTHQNGQISIEEFAGILTLTEYEIDLAMEKIRVHLLKGCAPSADAMLRYEHSTGQRPGMGSRQHGGMRPGALVRANSGVLGSIAPPSTSAPAIGRNVIKESVTLGHIFLMINSKDDGILSLHEMMDLATRVEVFVTEEEARQMLFQMDRDRNDRVEEVDFIYFMQQESQANTKKAFRVREAACGLRRWLLRGTTENFNGTTNVTASAEQWMKFKKVYEKLTAKKFPGFIGAPVLMTVMANLNYRLSALESRELTFLVSPDKSGRIHQTELHQFMGREHRSYGELLALLERELLKTMIDAYRENREEEEKSGQEDPDLAEKYKKISANIRKEVENVYNKPPPGHADGDGDVAAAPAPVRRPALSTGSQEIISVSQLQEGMASYFTKNKYAKEVPENQFPNLEEWASLTVLVGADITEGDIYGVKLKPFLDQLCSVIVTRSEEIKMKQGEKHNAERVAMELRRQIHMEARANSKGKKPDYKYVFDLFDENKNGVITIDELRDQLKRLQLINHLADHQIPALMDMFTKGEKSTVELSDFISFVEHKEKEVKDGDLVAVGAARGGDDDGGEDDDEEDDAEDMTSNIPPVVITRNVECDWLLWFLYREAYKIDPLDPESVITDLQIRCSETEMTMLNNNPSITVKEFWTIIFELGLQGNMSQLQFMQGVQLMCERGNGKEDDRVDYEALCRYIIRMGRAYNQLVQDRAKEDEKLFWPMLEEMKQFFRALSEEIAEGDKDAGPRFEKLFRRVDSNHDGLLTTREFKHGLRRLRYKPVKTWALRLVRRLFDQVDKNKDGLLSIKDFTRFILDEEPNRLQVAVAKEEKNGEQDKLGLSDDDEDDVFRRSRVLTEHQLMRKVSDVLMDVVPIDPLYPANHSEEVRTSVRRFFQRADQDRTGTVSEERFRAFIRRSGLQDNLTAAELRRLTDRLKKKQRSGEIVIDYESLVQRLFAAVESLPKSKSEVILLRLQDAAKASAAAGRSFLSLCSLIDLRLSGFISRDELIHTCKMMDCTLTPAEAEALFELLPNSAFAADNKVDYRVLQTLIDTYQAGETKQYDIEPRFNLTSAAPHALPTYASLGASTQRLQSSRLNLSGTTQGLQERQGLQGTIQTQMGYRVNAPLGFDPLQAIIKPERVVDEQGLSNNAYERIVRLIAERVLIAVEDRRKQWGAPFSLRRQFEVYDQHGSGSVPVRAFQGTLEEIGVSLSPSDLQALYTLFGNAQQDDDSIAYDAFLRAVESTEVAYIPPPLPRDPSGNRNSSLMNSGAMYRSLRNSGTLMRDGGLASSTGLRGLSNTMLSTSTAAYLHPRVLERFVQLKGEGNDPREFFSAQDFDRSGMIWSSRFINVITRLQLLQTEHQLSKAVEDFSCMTNRSMIMYEDFLQTLEQASAAYEGRNPRISSIDTTLRNSYVNGNGYDGLHRTANDGLHLSTQQLGGGMLGRSVHQSTNYPAVGRSADYSADDDSIRESMQRFRRSVNFGKTNYGADDDSSYNGHHNRGDLSAPKVSDSLTLGGLGAGRGGAVVPQSQRYRSSSIDSEALRDTTRIHQSASPSRVGSKIWGSHTPLAKKGKAPRVGDDRWCCTVCMYMENPSHAKTCAVCDSPNYAVRKDYQVKEQCRNCTFLNGQFAEECEMCGEPLLNSLATSKGHKR